MDTRFLISACVVLGAALLQMTPLAFLFGITADYALLMLLLPVFAVRPFAEYVFFAALPAVVFGLHEGVFLSSVFFGIALLVYGIRRRLGWQPWFAYYFFLVVAIVALYVLIAPHFVRGSMPIVLREIAVDLFLGACAYVVSARFFRI